MYQHGMKGHTGGQKMRFPLSQHGTDLGRELTVELVREDVLNAAFREQVLSQEMGKSLLTPVKNQSGW